MNRSRTAFVVFFMTAGVVGLRMCPHCEYDLGGCAERGTGNATLVTCPECGSATPWGDLGVFKPRPSFTSALLTITSPFLIWWTVACLVFAVIPSVGAGLLLVAFLTGAILPPTTAVDLIEKHGAPSSEWLYNWGSLTLASYLIEFAVCILTALITTVIW